MSMRPIETIVLSIILLGVSTLGHAQETSLRASAQKPSFDLYQPWRARGETLYAVEKPENL